MPAIEVTDKAAQTSTLLDKAERRQLTLVFCDLTDSVGLSTRLDPEDLRDLIAAYHRACEQSAQTYGGYVAQYSGDGVRLLRPSCGYRTNAESRAAGLALVNFHR